MLDGLNNFLKMINENWTTILVCAGLVVVFIKSFLSYKEKTTDEKISIAKSQIKEIVLKLITDAESDYEDWNKSGSVKRSQVIEEVFLEYPILSKVINQEDLIKWIDELINESLVTLKDVMNNN